MSHLHSIYDTDKHFIIDPKTRLITTESESLTLIQYDHNSKCYTFEIPRYIEGHDMSQCNKVEIHYDNISKDRITINHDFYTVTDLRVSEEDDTVILFSWTISNSATQLVGRLQFGISFECVSEDSALDYGWHTYYFDKVVVKAGIYNEEHVISYHSDFVDRMELLAAQNKETIEGFAENYEQNIHYQQTVQEVTDVLTPLANTLPYMTYRKRGLLSSVDSITNPFQYNDDAMQIALPIYYKPTETDTLELDMHLYFLSHYAYGTPTEQHIRMNLNTIALNDRSTTAQYALAGIMQFSESIKDVDSIYYMDDGDEKNSTIEKLLSPIPVLIQVFPYDHWEFSFQNDAVYSILTGDCLATGNSTYRMEAELYKVEYYTPQELSDALDLLNGEVV